MVSELKLSGNELIIYALIHGFCKDGEHEFTGSINYICEWTNLTKVTVIATLKKLISKNLIEKREYTTNNVKFCAYKMGSIKFIPVVKNFNWGGKESLPGGSKETLPNNTNINNTNNNKKEDTIVSKKERKTYPKEFDADFLLYQRKGSKKNAYERWKKLSDDDRVLMRKHIPFYLKSNDRQYLKDFEGYINQRMFESPVTDKHGNILFDPDLNTSSEYRPNGYYIRFMDEKGYYMYIGSYPDAFFDDGYKDDDRPDGASLVLNNMRGTITWKAESKTWELKR